MHSQRISRPISALLLVAVPSWRQEDEKSVWVDKYFHCHTQTDGQSNKDKKLECLKLFLFDLL